MRSSRARPGPLPSDWPRTRFSNWRARSIVGRLVDEAVGLAGATLIGLSLIDTVVSFWNDHVLMYPTTLDHIGALVTLPSWPWMIISGLMIHGNPRRRRSGWSQGAWWTSWRWAAPWVGAFAVIVGVLIVAFVLGAAKGSLRVLPGGVHQVSTLDLNSACWTTVTPAQNRLWAARFVREDAIFAVFGLAMVGFAAAMRLIRHRVAQAGLGHP